jgi:GNAT superfamily N-acetyltransferase
VTVSPYSLERHTAFQAAEDSSLVAAVAHIFSNSFGINPKTGHPYRLGPKKTRERLQGTNDLVIGVENSTNFSAGYIYGRTIESLHGLVVWIDSLAVLPNHRRKGLGTNLVRSLIHAHTSCNWVGCATPNPVAALIITRATGGKAYAGECSPPRRLIEMVESIRGQTPDLQGADFNSSSLLVRTRFSPTATGDSKDWSPPHPGEPPPWWSSLAHLPSEHEALLVIDRHATV